MTADQFNAALIKAGFPTVNPLTGTASLGQSEFARTVGISVRQVNRMATGEAAVPTPIAMLLNLMLKTKTKPEKLQA